MKQVLSICGNNLAVLTPSVTYIGVKSSKHQVAGSMGPKLINPNSPHEVIEHDLSDSEKIYDCSHRLLHDISMKASERLYIILKSLKNRGLSLRATLHRQ